MTRTLSSASMTPTRFPSSTSMVGTICRRPAPTHATQTRGASISPCRQYDEMPLIPKYGLVAHRPWVLSCRVGTGEFCHCTDLSHCGLRWLYVVKVSPIRNLF